MVIRVGIAPPIEDLPAARPRRLLDEVLQFRESDVGNWSTCQHPFASEGWNLLASAREGLPW